MRYTNLPTSMKQGFPWGRNVDCDHSNGESRRENARQKRFDRHRPTPVGSMAGYGRPFRIRNGRLPSLGKSSHSNRVNKDLLDRNVRNRKHQEFDDNDQEASACECATPDRLARTLETGQKGRHYLQPLLNPIFAKDDDITEKENLKALERSRTGAR
jgi:hypothetical protein